MASGHGEYTGNDGSHYEGHWENDAQTGKGFALTAQPKVKVGEWKAGQYLGERLTYTTERIYGIDISKYQHVINKRVHPIKWNQLRIIHLGTASRKAIHGQVNYPISFIYIKSTEGKLAPTVSALALIISSPFTRLLRLRRPISYAIRTYRKATFRLFSMWNPVRSRLPRWVVLRFSSKPFALGSLLLSNERANVPFCISVSNLLIDTCHWLPTSSATTTFGLRVMANTNPTCTWCIGSYAPTVACKAYKAR